MKMPLLSSATRSGLCSIYKVSHIRASRARASCCSCNMACVVGSAAAVPTAEGCKAVQAARHGPEASWLLCVPCLVQSSVGSRAVLSDCTDELTVPMPAATCCAACALICRLDDTALVAPLQPSLAATKCFCACACARRREWGHAGKRETSHDHSCKKSVGYFLQQ